LSISDEGYSRNVILSISDEGYPRNETMSCSGSHLGITINIKNTMFVKHLPMIDIPTESAVNL
jgi:hypothetical protein